MHRLDNLTQADVIREFLYDSEAGTFVRRAGPRQGKIAGSVDSWGHRQIKVNGRLYMAHRLAWLYMTGAWPADQIDHENLNPDDNRFENLRLADQSSNSSNQKRRTDNTSGLKGVSPIRGKWQASIQKNGRLHYLGIYTTKHEAFEAYKGAATRLHGEFARF